MIAEIHGISATLQQQIKRRFASTKISTKHITRSFAETEPERGARIIEFELPVETKTTAVRH